MLERTLVLTGAFSLLIALVISSLSLFSDLFSFEEESLPCSFGGSLLKSLKTSETL